VAFIINLEFVIAAHFPLEIHVETENPDQVDNHYIGQTLFLGCQKQTVLNHPFRVAGDGHGGQFSCLSLICVFVTADFDHMVKIFFNGQLLQSVFGIKASVQYLTDL